VTAKAHQKLIDIEGVTVADVDGAMCVLHLETWFEYVLYLGPNLVGDRLTYGSPMTLFGQVAPNGVTKVPSAAPSNANPSLGTEDDSAKREYGTHPEDPKQELQSPPPFSRSASPAQSPAMQDNDASDDIPALAATSSNVGGHAISPCASSGARDCPFMRMI
jgi:hypothetical protein